MQTNYRPGQWFLIVIPGALVALPPDIPSDIVTRLWDRLPAEKTLATVVDVLTTGCGRSFVELPPFVAAVAEGADVRIAVRGQVVARVKCGTDADYELSGAEVTTWSERFIGGATRIEITVSEPDVASALPVQSGVVRASAVSAELKVGDAAPVVDEAPDPAPVAPAPPAPLAVDDGVAEEPDDNGLDEHTWEPAAEALAAESFAPEVSAAESSAPTSDIDDFEQLFGETLHVASAQPAIPPLPGTGVGDHDGATISVAELQALRQQRATSDEASTQVIPVADVSVGLIRFSTGQVIDLDRTVIIGRRPSSTRASGDTMPHLVAVESPNQDISRNHLEVRPEAGAVVVIDLHTTNGSTLLRSGADPVRLHPGEQTLVLSGDVVDLGDGVTVAFEGIS
ncbi:MAG: FHA domain-containing protein [Microbacterium sp.]